MASVRTVQIIRGSHVVACLIAFVLLYERSWQGGLLNVMKKLLVFSVFSCLGVLPRDFGQVKG